MARRGPLKCSITLALLWYERRPPTLHSMLSHISLDVSHAMQYQRAVVRLPNAHLVKLDQTQLTPIIPYVFGRVKALVYLSFMCKAALFVLARALLVVFACNSPAAFLDALQRAVLAWNPAVAIPVLSHALGAVCEAFRFAFGVRRNGSRQSQPCK